MVPYEEKKALNFDQITIVNVEQTQWRPSAIESQNVKHKFMTTTRLKTIIKTYRHRFLQPYIPAEILVGVLT